MDKSLIAGLILAFVSGLSFLAYKHPKAYSRLFLVITAILIVIMSSVVSWNAGILIAFTKLHALIPESQQTVAKTITEDLSISTFTLIIVQFSVIAFLVFLLWLPFLISEDKKQSPPEEKRTNKNND